MSLLVPTLALAAALAVALPVPAAHASDCDALPTSAQRPRPCNPQQACLVKDQKTLAGSTLVYAQEGCRRMPTPVGCYGHETYNPQAECRQREQQRQRR